MATAKKHPTFTGHLAYVIFTSEQSQTEANGTSDFLGVFDTEYTSPASFVTEVDIEGYTFSKNLE